MRYLIRMSISSKRHDITQLPPPPRGQYPPDGNSGWRNSVTATEHSRQVWTRSPGAHHTLTVTRACNSAFISHSWGEWETSRKDGSGAGNRGLAKKQASCQLERTGSPSPTEFSLPSALCLTKVLLPVGERQVMRPPSGKINN